MRRHGTRTVSLVLRDGGNHVEVVSYRYPRPDLSRMAQLVEHAAGIGIRIVGIPLGSNRLEDWAAFYNTAINRPEMLFIVSAGNGGYNIDERPVYPAALDLDNMVVVSSADDFAGVAERVNWGRATVDYLIPAERQMVLGFNGDERVVSGSSYAVSRLVAFTANVLRQHPDSSVAELIATIDRHVVPARRDDLVAKGYFPDPRGFGNPVSFTRLAPLPGSKDSRAAPANARGVNLDILMLDERWDSETVSSAIVEASRILEQCNVTLGPISWFALSGPEHYRFLETGAAKTILSAFRSQHAESRIQMVLATDTRMQVGFEAEAFGRGNTRSRPWLNNSLWIARGAPDLGITIAHELFHILTNDGRHLAGNNNLMAAETSGNNTTLTRSQCARVVIDQSRNS